jgi:ubiquinone/menaquinone biosynthesis C-methylase UbiE
MEYDWGTKEWCEDQFRNITNGYDGWGHQWRGSQKFRYEFGIQILKSLLFAKDGLRILDIGCGLGDFTKKVWEVNPKNDVLGIDISENAISFISKKLPYIRFEVSSLPNLDFNENCFNLIICLEVLYYLGSDLRYKSLENMKKIIAKDGYIFLSSVLDNGKRYFDENTITTLVSTFFIIEKIYYIPENFYFKIENKLLHLLDICNVILTIMSLSCKDFMEWRITQKNTYKAEKLKLLRSRITVIPFGFSITRVISKTIIKTIIFVLSWKFPVVLSLKITEMIYNTRNNRRIFILAKNKNE